MFKERDISPECFERLLDWLDPESRDKAGLKYEQIRSRLIRIFVGRGCHEADGLADETLTRVALRAPEIASTYHGDPALYFYGVARNVHLEWLRKTPKYDPIDREAAAAVEPADTELDCLESCLDQLTSNHKLLILQYYTGERSAKIEGRRRMAEEQGITPGALQLKALRIRGRLRSCVDDCILSANA